MKKILLASLIAATTSFGALAQPATTSPMPSPKGEADKNAPLPGANSFTEGQAKDRALSYGLTSVADLKKDDDGIWRGSAMQDGKSVQIAVDYKGNVVPQTAP